MTGRFGHATVTSMPLRRASLLFLLSLLAGCQAEIHGGRPSTTGPEAPRWSTATDRGWSEMSRHLVGRWRATTPENRTITTSYRLISNGSALAETFTSASGKETMSVYHRDGGSLMVTHYCAQGNQARLKATEATETRVVFEFLDATNTSNEQGVMRRLVFTFRPDAFDLESMYRDGKGEEEASTLHFVRE